MSRVSLVVILLALFASAPGAQDKPGVQNTGQFEYRIPRIDLAKGTADIVEATLGFEIKNLGEAAVNVAIMLPFPTLQVEGLQFKLGAPGISLSGISYCQVAALEACDLRWKGYTVLRPERSMTASMVLQLHIGNRDLGRPRFGRFSGMLYVRDADNGKSWTEPFTLSDVAIAVR